MPIEPLTSSMSAPKEVLQLAKTVAGDILFGGDLLLPPVAARIADAILADRLARAGTAPEADGEVERLDWSEFVSGIWNAKTPFGFYRIEDQGENWSEDRFWLYGMDMTRIHRTGTFAVAASMAEADYRRKLTEATLARTQPDPALEEAKRIAAEDEREIHRMRAELDAVSAAIGSIRFLDLPDGGDVSLSEQVRRMRKALEDAEAVSKDTLGDQFANARLRDFARWAIREGAFTGGDLSGGEIQDKAEELGLLRPEPYDAEVHGEIDYGEPGVEIYVFTELLRPADRQAQRARANGGGV